MIPICSHLSENGKYSDMELRLLEKVFEHRVLEKNDFVLKEGEVCNSAVWVKKGALYQYRYDQDCNKIIVDFHTQNDWVVDSKSFTSRNPSEYNIQVYEETYIYMISIESIHGLIAKSQSFLQLGRILEAGNTRSSFFWDLKSPDERYAMLLEKRPEIVLKFPQKYIASYLNVTPETLSRVRKRLK